jgi:hypothetical protein
MTHVARINFKLRNNKKILYFSNRISTNIDTLIACALGYVRNVLSSLKHTQKNNRYFFALIFILSFQRVVFLLISLNHFDAGWEFYEEIF